MKKVLSIFSLLFVVLMVQAQTETQSTNVKPGEYVYCELVGTGKILSKKVTVEIDFGQATKFFSDNRYKDPATGKPKVFNSMVDALNFMSEQGWELENAYPVGDAQSGYVYHWILQKKRE